MIYCDVSNKNIHGRLGNNLFKIAAGLSLAKDNNDQLYISEWEYNIFNNLNINHKKEDMEINNFYSEPFFHFAPIPYVKNMEIKGYFQSEKYFEHNKDLINHTFQFSDNIINYAKNKYPNILEDNNISIHIRRGDYLTSGYPVLDKEYYKSSFDKIHKIKRVNSVVVFSDDIRWCKDNLDGTSCFKNSKMTFICGEKDYIDLYLMSRCKNNIISNSSFSWWGAWLNRNKEKIIFAPSIWFGDKLKHNDTKDLIPKSWLKN